MIAATELSDDDMAPKASPWDTLRGGWTRMDMRERQLVGAAIALIVLALVWLIGVQPAWRTLRSAPVENARLEVQWQTMQRQAADVGRLRATSPLAPGLALKALQAATERLGPGARLSLQGERAVLSLTDIGGDALLQWLAETRRGARANPVEASLTAAGDGYTGTVIVALGGRP